MELKCYNCGKSDCVKNGWHHGRQRYKCKECGYQFTNTREHPNKSDITKSLAITLYLAGLTYKKAASLVKESHSETILNWVKEHKFEARKSDPEVTREQWHKKRYSLERYLGQESYRIKFNRRDTDELKKIYSVPFNYGTPQERDGDFKRELKDIKKYMGDDITPKSAKRFIVIEVHRYSGEVQKVMMTP